ncbi:MAG: hypothetical protein ACPGVK_04540 [Halocynthiibacter sp.]
MIFFTALFATTAQSEPLEQSIKSVLDQLFSQSFSHDPARLGGCHETDTGARICQSRSSFIDFDMEYGVQIFDLLLKERVHFDAPDSEHVAKGGQFFIKGNPQKDPVINVVFQGEITKNARILTQVTGVLNAIGRIDISIRSQAQR